MEIEKILQKLFGSIIPVCETREDNIRYDNLEVYERLLKFVLEEFVVSSYFRDSNYYSARHIGKKAYDILNEYQEYIKSKLEEDLY